MASDSKIVDEEIQQVKTNAKRYTYLLGPSTAGRTISERFAALAGAKDINLDDIIKAFSVSVLTKEFYTELFKWYEWALSEDVGITFPKNTTTTDDDREKLGEQIIRLITRLLFVWFIKQQRLVPDSLFNIEELKRILKNFNSTSKTNGDYYNAILQNLFFATLNKAVNERGFAKEENIRDIKTLYRYTEMFALPESKVLELFKPIPFLNGGLFECLDKEIGTDGIKYHLDGFSRSDKKLGKHFKYRAFIPNWVFFDEEKGIIPLLQRYNFTVEENNPNDSQVALDPELLGNVFENLLGAYNPETKETARKQSGSFYTPKEIVDFMVSESLITYLQNDFEQHKEAIRHLFESEDLPTVLKGDKKLCTGIADKLKQVKIIDPACGSGAFPMGILKKMVEVLEKLEPKKTIYDQKLHLIEECIYGVDIQTIAAQISKLRFFISLIVEQGEMDISKPNENYGVITLPNLETKFVAANTLIGLHKKPAQTNLFEDPRIEIVKKEILEVRHQHFYAKTAKDKRTLREKDTKLRTELVVLLEANHEFAPEDAKQVAKWNPYDQNDSSPFFDTEWMFGLKDGFDIVIGNPPYVQLQNDGGRLAKMYQHCGFTTFARTGDVYSLFYEKGFELLKPKGHLAFITSNKWMRAGYGENTRKFFAEKTNPVLLIDFAGQKIFESATVDVNILMFAKDKNRQKTKSCIIKEKLLNNLSVFVKQQGSECNFSTAESWTILSPIEQSIKHKIEALGTPLKDWDINIYRGILTGYNEAFIIDENKKEEILANCITQIEREKTVELIRPILRGRDIKRYSYDFDNKYLIATFPSKNHNIDNYPAVKKFLEGFMPKLKQTGEMLTDKEIKQVMAHAKANGITLNESDLKTSRKKTNNKWFETQDSISYWDDFSKQKIVWAETMRIHKGDSNNFPRFGFEESGKYVTDKTCFFATGKQIKFIIGVLNSIVGRYLLSQYVSILDDGGYLMQKIYLEKIPIAPYSSKLSKRKSQILLMK
ncbi:Eco57I restriction-modification methylase domain-containing protein [Ferruginibacter albus]|uniref:Eco57I restriction-modification methylase domain-containing protein n=1 Tax=Ferruginibacter albus TaxID=2875540 RepID=UPI001CC7B781|nr:N-6 DNA methylase [Ferruginibacter albus]